MNRTLHKLPILLGAITVLVAGCSKTPETGFFADSNENRPTVRIMERQADLGAVRDGTLYAFHFDGDELNSLGRQKLTRIERGTPADTDVILHVDLDPDADDTAARKTSVEAFLGTLGVPADRMAINDGPNMQGHPVGPVVHGGAAGSGGIDAAAIGGGQADQGMGTY